jgi:prevent-host-death family protein
MEFVGVLTFRQHLAKYLGEVAEGKHFVILRNNQPIAQLLPYEERAVSQEQARYNVAQVEPAEIDRLVALFAPRLVNQVLEQCWQDKATARRVLLHALLKLDE